MENNLNFGSNFLNYTDTRYEVKSLIKELLRSDDYNKIKNIIINQHKVLFTYDNLINGNREDVQKLFTSNIFLNVLDNIAGTISSKLLETEIIFINKIVHDYFEYYKNGKDNNIRSILLSITYNINSDRIKSLSPIIGVNKARLLSILSYSSYKIEKIVHRINNFLLETDISTDDIEEIFKIIYGPIRINKKISDDYIGLEYTYNTKIINMFCYSMLEYCDDEDSKIMFNRISTVLMNLLTSLSSSVEDQSMVISILMNYTNTVSMMNISRDKLRFSIKEHIPRNSNLYSIIYYIENNNDIIIY